MSRRGGRSSEAAAGSVIRKPLLHSGVSLRRSFSRVLKVIVNQARTDVEVEAMAMAPVPTPHTLWREPPVLALAADTAPSAQTKESSHQIRRRPSALDTPDVADAARTLLAKGFKHFRVEVMSLTRRTGVRHRIADRRYLGAGEGVSDDWDPRWGQGSAEARLMCSVDPVFALLCLGWSGC